MIINEIKEKFKIGKENNSFRRINETFKVDIFIGYRNEKATITIKEKCNVDNVDSSKYIDANIIKLNNSEESYLNFSLLDESLYDIFLKFCEDIIINIKDIEKDKASYFIINRWELWRKIFKNRSGIILSEKEIVGLIGELLFIKDFMLLKFDEKYAITSWNGPEKTSKDFEFGDTWYEIKGKNKNTLDVTINSIEQLDSELVGMLVVNSFEKTNENFVDKINLNKLVDEILQNIKSFDAKCDFKQQLFKYGYIYHEDYDRFNYKLIDRFFYKVEEEFPRLIRGNLPDGISNVSYNLILDSIKDYICNEEVF